MLDLASSPLILLNVQSSLPLTRVYSYLKYARGFSTPYQGMTIIKGLQFITDDTHDHQSGK